MIKLLIFDWDDVFTLGSKEGYFACYHEALKQVDHVLDHGEEKKRILSKWGKGFKETINALLREKPELIDKANAIYDREYWGNTFVKNLTLVEGSNKMLRRLKKKYILTVATGGHPKMLNERVFPFFKIPNVFSQVFTSFDISDEEQKKPHPYMLLEIMKKQSVTPDETLYIGDAITDVQMAYNAGVVPVVVLTGHLNRKEAEDLKVKYIIDKVTSLESVLKKFE